MTYSASAKPRKGHGLDVLAKSRAGVANELWRITEPGLVLTIDHHMADRRDTIKARFGEALFAGDVRFEVSLKPLLPPQHEAGLSMCAR